jgi:hypothetical protein
VDLTKGAGNAAAEPACEAREDAAGAKPPPAPSKRPCRPKAVPDSVYANMWRVQWPDGRVSDLANLTRVNDAIASFVESAERRERQARKTGGAS